ncbi:MAG: glycine oxidase ThiO [Gemmatimonadota bacterium]
MSINSEVIVIGGGVVGAAIARELSRAGRDVVVLERGTDQGASWQAAAGMLAPQIEALPEDPLFELGLSGRERYEELAGPLRETTGIDIGFWQEGIARVGVDEADAVALRSRVAWQRQQGHLCDWFDADEVRVRWPWLGPTYGALWAPREAALDPRRLVAALVEDARLSGARIMTDAVLGLERQGNRIVGAIGLERYSAEQVIVAAGAWSPLLAGLPRPLPIVPIRGQMASFPWPGGVERSIVYGKHAYLVARGAEAVAGSTMEHAGYNPDVTAAGLAHIFTEVSSLCPALSGLEVNRTWAGLRPITPDGLPIIGREPRVEGLWYATGHGRNGILLAAITGVIMAQLINGEPTVEDLEPYRPQRFFDW